VEVLLTPRRSHPHIVTLNTFSNTPTAFANEAESSQTLLRRLEAALERNDEPAFLNVLKAIVKTQLGFAAAAESAGINRTALYKSLSAKHDPKLSTVMRLLQPLGLRLSLKRSSKVRRRSIKELAVKSPRT
jgi:probable addiction module antidote protein